MARKKWHGLSSSKEYKSWCKIVERTTCVTCIDYANYGKVGIGIQDSWLDFRNFIAYIGMQPCDGLRYSVDRLDNSKGYVEGNVRWATFAQQARNRNIFNNNTTGYNGVQERNRNGNTTFVARWVGLDGKTHTKDFAAGRHGYEAARFLAAEYRNKMIAELNSQGAGYSENHGK